MAPSPRTSSIAEHLQHLADERIELVDAAGQDRAPRGPLATAAAPRATASSPATVGTLSVSDSSRVCTAMAVVAAIVFITVLGNSSGESPARPRAR